ncbi:UNVERIFIED_CONTAM: hypothetical protein Sradi_6142000 [Sesamum radiatum]|uniref:Uncharacterized protein n=1 Tax=Sesamum radiatum TaxID=300843 RepID=A0AAW2KJP6_SESRA
MKIKFPVNGEVGEVHADPFKCLNVTFEAIKREKDTPVNVQPVEELLTLKLVPGDSGIGSKMTDDIREEVIIYLQKNKDIFAWAPQDMKHIDLSIITHHLNIESSARPVKQKKRHFQT